MKNKLIKSLAIILAVVLLCISFAACGNGKGPKIQDTLYIDSFPDKIYGDAPFILSASGGSGNGAVTFIRTSGTAATVTKEGLVTIIAAGEITVKAIKDGDTNKYKETESAEITIRIARRDAAVPQPYYDEQHFYLGDGLPELHTDTPGGSAAFDAGQTIREGTFLYSWTFTPDDDNYNWSGLAGSISITAEAIPAGDSPETAILLRPGKPVTLALADGYDSKIYKFIPGLSDYYKITSDGGNTATSGMFDIDTGFLYSDRGAGYILSAYLTAGETYYFLFGTGNPDGQSYTAALESFTPAAGDLPATAIALEPDETADITFPVSSEQTFLYYKFTPETAGAYTVTGSGQNLHFNTMDLYDGNMDGINYNLSQGETDLTGVKYFLAEKTYYFKFSNNYGRTQSLQINLTFTPEKAGKTFETAIPMEPGVTADIALADNAAGLYYVFTPETDGAYQITLSETNHGQIKLYGEYKQPLIWDADIGPMVEKYFYAGDMYYILFGTDSPGGDSYTAAINLLAPGKGFSSALQVAADEVFNIGLTAEGDFMIYKFIPGTDGSYSFTVTGKHNDTAIVLYNDTFNFLDIIESSGSVMTADLTSGKTYYFSAATEAAAGDSFTAVLTKYDKENISVPVRI